MHLIKSGKRAILRHIRIRNALKLIDSIPANYPQSVRRLLRTVRDTIADEYADEEALWINQIESLRRELNANTSEFLRIDYGAGDPDCSRNEHPVSSGRKIKSTVGKISKTASKPYFWTLFLFKLVREFKPLHCVELGTCFGISSSYLAAALKLNQRGILITLEGAESCAELATQNFATLGLDNIDVVVGRFVDTLEGVLKRHGPIDFAFIDGHHEQEATIAYFEQIHHHLARQAVLVFDDISWSDGMRNAWNFISRHEQTKFALDLGVVGVCLYDSDVQQVPAMRIPLV